MNDFQLHIDQTRDGATNQGSPAGRPKGVSVLRRAGLLFIVMILLVGAASGISLWFSTAVQKATESMQIATSQSEISAQIAEIARLQSLARSLSLAVLAIAVLFTIGSIWVARRSILLPIRKLTGDIRQITQARSVASLPPITPLEQSDEIGELSWTLSRMVDWLKDSYESLETQVEERTRGLQRRRVQIEVAAQIARDIAAMRDLENLLYRSVNLIRDRFNFYHAGIFLNDQRDEYAVLRAATGEAGREMLARSYRLKIGQTGLVGHVAQTGESRVASDVDLDEVYFKSPLLRETQSEAVLPLKIAGQVIGVLDVQSQEPAAFDEESITTLQIMADQLAIAIQNARLLQESQENLKELETTYGRINRQAWERFTRGSQVVGYEFDGVSSNPILRDQETPAKGSTVATGPGSGSPFSIPLRVRGEVIGTLDVWSQEADLSDADVYLLATISNRISQILESTRLLQEAQRLAWREQQVNTIATQVRNSINLDTILQNTVRELGKSLGATRAFIQIGGNLPHPEADQPQADQPRQPAEDTGGMEPAHLEPGTDEDAGTLPAHESRAAGSNGRSHSSPSAATRQGESEA
jgi:GAF domain-containing protein/HAMP domain-containing protein